MQRVGIKELKARLSEIMDRARRGERFVVTLHGRDIAEISPVAESASVKGVWRLAQDGKVRWNGRKPEPGHPVPITGRPLSETLLEDRGDSLP